MIAVLITILVAVLIAVLAAVLIAILVAVALVFVLVIHIYILQLILKGDNPLLSMSTHLGFILVFKDNTDKKPH